VTDATDYADFFESAAVGLVVVAPDGRLRRANRRLCEMFGRSEAELCTLSFRELTHPGDLQLAEDFNRRMLAGEFDTVTTELRALRRDGSSFRTRIESRLHRDAGGQPAYFSGVMLDVTLQHEADSALRIRSAELTAANAALLAAARHREDFLSSLSQELRTPLGAILGLSDALTQELHGKLEARQLRSLVLIEESGRHLLGMIDDLLDLSRIEAGVLAIEPEDVAVHDICAASLRAVAELVETRGQELSYKSGDELLRVRADPKRLERVLTILLTNAVKFTERNGSLGLEVRTLPEREMLELTVWDGGIGIDPAELPRLFKPFTKLETGAGPRSSGLGLGLVLAHRLVELHGGSISVSSEPGRGSRFAVGLPWRATERATALVQTRRHAPRVLIVEDSPVASGNLMEQLEQLGARVWIHETLSGAFEQVLQIEPHLIILDVFLPDGSGWTLLRRLRADQRTRDVPVAVSSAVDDRQTARLLGAREFLGKPARSEEIAALLDQALPTSASGRSANVSGQSLPPGVRPRPTVLYAEDNEVSAAIVREFLEGCGYRVEIAKDGKQVVELTRVLRPALVLMDLRLPGLDGVEAMRKIRRLGDDHSGQVPIVALTGLAMPGDRERCLTAGATDFRVKPLALAQLRELVEKLCG
jgi:PAS domain S-box-containing protein